MIRIFCVTQPKVISFITMITDHDEVYPVAIILGKAAGLLRRGKGYALYSPQNTTQEVSHEAQATTGGGGVGVDPVG